MLMRILGKGWSSDTVCSPSRIMVCIKLECTERTIGHVSGGLMVSYLAILTMNALTVDVVVEQQQTQRNYQTIN